MRTTGRTGVVALAGVAVFTLGGVIYANQSGLKSATSAPGTATGPVASSLPRSPASAIGMMPAAGPALAASPGLGESYAALIAAVRPALVSIARPGQGTHVSPESGMLFVDPYASGSTRIGAGVIIAPSGLVLTSLQVVGQERDLWVTLATPSKTALRGTLVAADRSSDLALVRLETSQPLPALRLGDSDRLQLGDLVLALGSPFGFAETVTSGIVSSNHRQLVIEGRSFVDLIQTDARLNPGNAGGPLVNIDGEVVGINIGTLSLNSNFVGIGFAVASNQARALLQGR